LNNERSRLKATQHIRSNLQRHGAPSHPKKKMSKKGNILHFLRLRLYVLDLEAVTAAAIVFFDYFNELTEYIAQSRLR